MHSPAAVGSEAVLCCAVVPQCRVHVLAYPAWQCGGGYAELTERVPLLHMDFRESVTSLTGAVVEARHLQEGTCHAVLLWMDYDLDPDGSFQVTSSQHARHVPLL